MKGIHLDLAKWNQKFKALSKMNMKDLFAQKPMLAVLIPVAFFLILTVPIILILSNLGAEDPAPSDGPAVAAGGIVTPSPENSPTIEVLPETERILPEQDPFGSDASIGANEIVLMGIVSNSDGVSTAIIKAGGSSYIVETGDLLGDSPWSVKGISENDVILTNGETEKTIALDEDGQ